MRKYICIDIGGTAIKYGIIDEYANILIRQEIPTEAEKGGESILEKVIMIVQEFSQKECVSGVCISTAGMVDTDSGAIVYSSHLIPNYIGINFKNVIEERFALGCEVENDVNCAGIAEYETGAAQGSQSALMLTIGTGIGGCMILNGNVIHGVSNSACEVGYMRMHGNDFQSLGAASTLTRKVAERKQEPEKLWDGYSVFEQARQGDKICNSAINEMCEILGEGIANLCYVFNPQVVVLGGGIMAQKEFLDEKINEALDRYLLPNIRKHTRIAYAEHKNNAGMLGAFYHYRKKCG